MDSVVDVKDVTKNYQLGKVEVRALRGVDLSIEEGDFISLVGPSGSGKTTLLNLIGCLDKPTSGEISVGGRDVVNMRANELADLRRQEIGFIFQSFNLIPVLTTYENVEFPLLLQKVGAVERKKRVTTALEEVGLAEYANHRPNELSGGQQQRVSIARALVGQPMIVLADEPTANLDSETGGVVIDIMLKLNREEGVTFLFSTHDPAIVEYARRILHIHDGRIIKEERRGNNNNTKSASG